MATEMGRAFVFSNSRGVQEFSNKKRLEQSSPFVLLKLTYQYFIINQCPIMGRNFWKLNQNCIGWEIKGKGKMLRQKLGEDQNQDISGRKLPYLSTTLMQ